MNTEKSRGERRRAEGLKKEEKSLRVKRVGFEKHEGMLASKIRAWSRSGFAKLIAFYPNFISRMDYSGTLPPGGSLKSMLPVNIAITCSYQWQHRLQTRWLVRDFLTTISISFLMYSCGLRYL